MKFVEERKRLLTWLRAQIIGPASADNELQGSPLERYHSGILFPILPGSEGEDPAENEDEEDRGVEEQSTDSCKQSAAEGTVRWRRYMPPSSVGLSFLVRGPGVKLQVCWSAATYKNIGSDRDNLGRFVSLRFERSIVGGDNQSLYFQAPLLRSSKREIDKREVLDGCAEITVVWREHLNGWLTTISIANRQNIESSPMSMRDIKIAHVEQSFFEVNLRVVVESGELLPYPRVEFELLSEEEKELELQYKERKIFALGHGAAAEWQIEKKHSELWVDFMPTAEVPQVTADVADRSNKVLNLGFLANEEDTQELCAALGGFILDYLAWITSQKKIANALEPQEKATAERMICRMDVAAKRMQDGVAMLRQNPRAVMAFRLANRAMLDQMCQTDIIKSNAAAATSQIIAAQNLRLKASAYNWRPFQLAFLLTVMASTIGQNDHFRDTVDLIWFPTGGGKTEAYLGLIAFLIIWRRLQNPQSGGGTTVLMRYTLRLLTGQQYLRACRMICALELIRRRERDLKSTEPISIGLWVGEASSPNRFQTAKGCVDAARSGDIKELDKLVLKSCPWCGSPFHAHALPKRDNYNATLENFSFTCLNKECDFADGANPLPCNVVDEALYEQPPTLLVATIDKFARLTWESRSNVFFGDRKYLPPELIIQDELHLIAGALGSIAGLYEAGLDTLLQMRGVFSKYVASTATIRMAEDQVKKLYGRKLAIFPPPGLSCSDSYFARTVPLDKRPGRFYVGYLAPRLDRSHCLEPLAATLLVVPTMLFNNEELLDAWWTQVVYHGSLKGVGKSHNAFNSGVLDILKRFFAEAKEQDLNKSLDRGVQGKQDIRMHLRLSQLTSLRTAEENAKTFAALEKDHQNQECLDVVLATNMVSVGLDVARLALMIINGQPLTTAEYIQASSRVGRSSVPGIVLVNYYRDQARSLSHFENFRPYHDSFYRFVEPTSVTPFTLQARKRALHAALVLAVRHSSYHFLDNKKAENFSRKHEEIQKIAEILKKRCAKADPERRDTTSMHIDCLIEEWEAQVSMSKEQKRQLVYETRENSAECLIYNHDDQIRGLWPTLQSMRNVEHSGLLKAYDYKK